MWSVWTETRLITWNKPLSALLMLCKFIPGKHSRRHGPDCRITWDWHTWNDWPESVQRIWNSPLRTSGRLCQSTKKPHFLTSGQLVREIWAMLMQHFSEARKTSIGE